MRTKMSRAELVAALITRDGMVCQYPDCEDELDLEATGSKEVTIDHTEPQAWCRENGWTEDQIWDLTNLTLMHKRCNAKKSDLRYLPDGTLPQTKRSRFRYRRDKRAQRPEICTSCNAGRNLQQDEYCNACGSGPQPARYPKWRQMRVSECDHDLFFCVACTIWSPEIRRSALDALITGGNGYE